MDEELVKENFVRFLDNLRNRINLNFMNACKDIVHLMKTEELTGNNERQPNVKAVYYSLMRFKAELDEILDGKK